MRAKFHRRILYASIGMISSLIGNSDAFPILRQWDFFNHAGVCPLPRVAADALRKYAQQAEEMAYIETGCIGILKSCELWPAN